MHGSLCCKFNFFCSLGYYLKDFIKNYLDLLSIECFVQFTCNLHCNKCCLILAPNVLGLCDFH